MIFEKKNISLNSLKIESLSFDGDQKTGRLYLYFLKNDLHDNPFAFIEDVYIFEDFRGQGIGTMLIEEAIKSAKENNCYKIICTSRYSRELVHKFYSKFGFKDYGKEFRLDL